MEWMAWTPVTAAFFGGIALLLVLQVLQNALLIGKLTLFGLA